MYSEEIGKLHYEVHFGIHNDDQKGFSLVKETGKSRRDQGLGIGG